MWSRPTFPKVISDAVVSGHLNRSDRAGLIYAGTPAKSIFVTKVDRVANWRIRAGSAFPALFDL
jgi:hypothetical protein